MNDDELLKLVADWRKRAQELVPEDYAGRGLHHKYLKADNYAAGLDDAAYELEDIVRSAPENGETRENTETEVKPQ